MTMAEGVYRRFTQMMSGQATLPHRQTGLESQAVDQVAPPGFEMTRTGLRFDIGFLAVTGIAPVAAIPTTAAQWLLYNPTDKIISVDEVGMVLVSGTAAAGILVLGCIVGPGTVPATLPTANSANIFTRSRSQGGTNQTKQSGLIVVASQTLASSPSRGWGVVAKSDSANTAILSVAAINSEVNGELVIPARGGLALCTMSGTGTSPLFAPHCVYTEFNADVE